MTVRLTKRQRQVFNQLIEGKSNEEIAARLGVHVKTVKAHITPILGRYGCETRCKLIVRHYKGQL